MAKSPVYSTRFKMTAVLVLAVAITLIGVAVNTLEGGGDDPVLGSGDAQIVEALLPPRHDQVPQQTTIGIDLVTGWDGTLVIGGTEIPEDELQVTPEIGLVQFTPAEGRTVEQLRAGENCVTAVIWRVSDGRGTNDRRIPWCFEVV
jgi:hypothetical protein